MSNNRILLWDSSVADMLHGRKFGGIAVQMRFWADVFLENRWEANMITTDASFKENGINFHHISQKRNFNLIIEWINVFNIIRKTRPKYIVLRGAQRVLFPLNVIGKIFGAEVIFFGASDVNFEQKKANVGNNINRLMFERAVQMTQHIVVQNKYQKDTLRKNFNRDALEMFNIWHQDFNIQNDEPQYAASWIANYRRLKRSEWFVHLAEKNPTLMFAMAGGEGGDASYFREQTLLLSSLSNGHYCGQVTFEESNAIIADSKVLACTSTYEGFPNTFLQAWAAKRPVITTVDPNGIVQKHGLGIVVSSEEELNDALQQIINDAELYECIQNNIQNFFEKNFDATVAYNRLINYANNKEV